MNNSAIIYKKLVQHGVKHVFGYSGGAIMPLIDQFHPNKNKDIDLIINSHEQNCGHAATGYAKSCGKTGIVLVTSGPGITNCVTPLLDAKNDSTPLIVISANVGLKHIGTNAFQEAPATLITKPVTKWSYFVNDKDNIEDIFDRAFYIANEGKKGSVHIDIPKCVLNDFSNKYENREKNSGKKKYKRKRKNNDIYIKKYNREKNNYTYSKPFDELANIISNSSKPILYVGQGANYSYKNVRTLSNYFNIPVTTTLHGMGIVDETDELSLQMCGMHGHAAANYALQEADCIIALGSRFDDRTTGEVSKYAPKCENFIHFNIEEDEINKVVKTDNYVIGDLQITLPLLIKHLKNNVKNKELWLDQDLKYKKRMDWVRLTQRWKKIYSFSYNETKQLKTQEVLIELNKQITNNMDKYFITTGVGNHQMMSCQFIDWKYPQRFISSGSLGVMGAGLPYAIGVQFANQKKSVINIDGDSSFLMTLSDLKTVKEHNLPLKILILNNGTQDMVRVWEDLFFEKRITATENIQGPKFSKLAESFGIKSIITNKYNLKNNMNYFLNYNGPILMECITERDYCFPLVPPGAGLDEMILNKKNISNLDSKANAPS